MTLSRRTLFRSAGITAGAVLLARPLGILAQPLGTDDAYGTARASRLFPGQRVVHADMHNHTIFSDADPGATAEMAYRTMEEGGMDAAALTDHASLSWAPGGVPSEFPCPPDGMVVDPLSGTDVGEGCRSLFGLSNEEWDQTLALSQDFTVTADQAAADSSLREYLGIRGFEWSSPTLGHINVWFTREFIDPLHTGGLSAGTTAADLVHDGRDVDPTPLTPALEELLRTAGGVDGEAGMAGFQQWLASPPDATAIGGGADGLAGFNHPGREAGRFGDFTFEPALRERMVSLELFNRKEDYLFELLDVGRPSALVQCLAQGWRPGILGVSDQHSPVKRKPSDVGQGRGGLWVGELTQVGVRDALRSRRFFATRIKGLRLDAAANGVRMGQAFAHGAGQVLFQIDMAAGSEHAGRTLNCHVIAAPSDGGQLPQIIHEQTFALPTDVLEFSVGIDPEVHPWVALRISEPALADTESDDPVLGFRADGRAAGTPYEPLGGAWAYTSPWHFDPEATTPIPGRAPLTQPQDDPTTQPSDPSGSGGSDGADGSGGSDGADGSDGSGSPGGQPTASPMPAADSGSEGGEDGAINPMVVRRAGADRVSTAAALSRATFAGGIDTVLVASADTFADALGGSAAAATLGAPILLVRGGVPAQTAEEIRRLAPRRIVILGGLAVVDSRTEQELRRLATTVQRVAGAERYATSAAISQTFFSRAPVLFVASGADFPDALAGAAAVAQSRGPVLLVQPDTVPEVIEQEIRRLAPGQIFVLGGPSAVTESVEQVLRGISPTERLAGASRYATSAAISRATFDTATSVVIASGENFPDALAAAPVAFAGSGPVLLVQRDQIPPAVDEEIRRLRPEVITIAGGPAAVSADVEAELGRYNISEGA